MTTVKVNVAGTEVPVEIPEEQLYQIKQEAAKDAKKSVMLSIVEKYIAKAEVELDMELEADEEDEILENYVYPENPDMGDFLDEVVSGRLYDFLKNKVTETVMNRTHVFKVTVRATCDFEVTVVAKDEHEAESFVEELDYYDLGDYVESCNTDYEVMSASITNSVNRDMADFNVPEEKYGCR